MAPILLHSRILQRPTARDFYQEHIGNRAITFDLRLVGQIDGNNGHIFEASVPMAVALTGLCARYGFGKVYFVSKHWFGGQGPDNVGPPKSYHDIPDLTYVRYNWTDETRDEWFRTSHILRVFQLAARGGVLSHAVQGMPITLDVEEDNYANIRLHGTSCLARICYAGHELFVGWLDNIRNLGGSYFTYGPDEATKRSFHQADKSALQTWKMITGVDVAQRLHEMYQEQRPEALDMFGTIVLSIISVNKAWAALGGRTVTPKRGGGRKAAGAGANNDGALGVGDEGVGGAPSLDPGEYPLMEPSEELKALRKSKEEDWDARQSEAYDDYQVYASEGVAAISYFMLENTNWQTLTLVQKKAVVELWDREEEYEEALRYSYRALRDTGADEAFPTGPGTPGKRYFRPQYPVIHDVVLDDRPASRTYRATFANGHWTIWVSGEGLLCGFRAVSATIEAMFPALPCPTLEQLHMYFLSDEYRKASADDGTIKTNLSVDQVGAVLYHWGKKNAQNYRVGYVAHGEAPVLVSHPDEDEASATVVWIYNDNAQKRSANPSGVLNHFYGMEPKEPESDGDRSSLGSGQHGNGFGGGTRGTRGTLATRRPATRVASVRRGANTGSVRRRNAALFRAPESGT